MTREKCDTAIGRDDLEECWCCGSLHDALGKLCPSCDDAGCKHFGGECESGHKPVLPDGGTPEAAMYLWKLNYLDWDMETELSRLELRYDEETEDPQRKTTEMTIVTW